MTSPAGNLQELACSTALVSFQLIGPDFVTQAVKK